MSPIFRDPHPTCARCRGAKCTSYVTCILCKDWSVAQWEAFCKTAPIVGALRYALQVPPFPLRLQPFLPPPLLLQKLGALRLFLVLTPLRQRGVVVHRSRGVSLALALVGSPLPPPAISVGRGGGGTGIVASGGKCGSAASSLQGVGVVGTSRS